MNARFRIGSFPTVALPFVVLLAACGNSPSGPSEDEEELQEIPVSWARVSLGKGGGMTFETLTADAFKTCGLTEDGSAWCWSGSGAEPTAVPGDHRFVEISAGTGFQCGVRLDGAMLCWGRNDAHQLGDGTTETRDEPTPVAGDVGFVTVSAGSDFSCGLDAQGAVYCWGSITLYAPFDEPLAGGVTPAAVDTEERFTQVTVGNRHACGLTGDGRAFCWGEGDVGQLGDGTTVFGRNRPVPVSGGLRFESLDAGGVNTCGTTAAGEAWCWGSDSIGQLGRGSDPLTGTFDRMSAVPVRVSNPRG